MQPSLSPFAHANGKVILFGEHSVVYGHPAIAAGLENGIELRATRLAHSNAPIKLSIPAWGVTETLEPSNEHPVARSAAAVIAHCDGPLRGWEIAGSSSLPSRAGLGSSAALTVALSRLVLGDAADDVDIVAGSLAGEEIFHGSPSGLDSEVAARGGIVRFIRGQKTVSPTGSADFELVIVPSGIPRSTADQIDKVTRQCSLRPQVARSLLDLLGKLADQGQDALRSNDLPELGELMTITHHTLAALNVSCPTLDRLVSVGIESGALGAKLTGAGGGGCILALPAPGKTEHLIATYEAKGFSAFSTRIKMRPS